MQDDDIKFVDYATYCRLCKYEDLTCNDDPCDECLDFPVNTNSERPIKWEEKA